MTTDFRELQNRIRTLAAERNAVVLAHNYQLPEVQDVADFVGDSLGLSREAARTGEAAAGKESTTPSTSSRAAFRKVRADGDSRHLKVRYH